MFAPTKIKKRSGLIVPFDQTKIKSAVEKAFQGNGLSQKDEAIELILSKTVAALQSVDMNVATVEQVQDLVEKNLMAAGYFDVAKAYILYRHEHSRSRETNNKNIEQNDFYVTKKDGRKELFSFEKLEQTLKYLTADLETVIPVSQLAAQIRNELYNFITTKEILQASILRARSLIETDPVYSKIAARLLLNSIYAEAIKEPLNYTDLEKQVQKYFVINIKKAVRNKKIAPQVLALDLERLSQLIRLDRDDLFQYLGIQTLNDRYLIRDQATDQLLETPQMFWLRVAIGLSLNETDPEKYIPEFYEIMSTLKFVPSTPTLFHSATTHAQLSSCYISTVDDSLSHIFKSVSDNAEISKWSGGIGNDWTNIRGTGSVIKGTGVNSQGVIPFLKIANDTTVAINRSGKRRGATCAYLEVWHYDIEDFVELRKNTGDERRRTHDMDTAAWIPDLFMKRVESDEDWTLFSSEEVADLHHIYGRKFEQQYLNYENKTKTGEIKLFKKIKAKDLWKKILQMNYETGHPWITFKDPCNLRSPQRHVGTIHSSNLCTEITLNTSKDEIAVCNLGSINLKNHLTADQVDYSQLEKTTNLAIRMLDNVIDLNFYPVQEAENSNKRHRPVGLGLMGLQDVFYTLDVPFESAEALDLNNEISESVSYFAISASVNLAKERGAYSTYSGSSWDKGIMPHETIKILSDERGQTINLSQTQTKDWDSLKQKIAKYGMRNSNCLAIAPTATISNIAGCAQSIEPTYKNLYVKSNVNGEFIIINEYLVKELKKLNLWNAGMLEKLKFYDGSIAQIEEIPTKLKLKFKEVFEISSKWIIDQAAERGKWLDQSQSLNLYFIGSQGKELHEMFLYAWKKGLKTTYYLRSLAATQVEKATVDKNKFGTTHNRSTAETPPPTVVEPKLCKITDPSCESCQ